MQRLSQSLSGEILSSSVIQNELLDKLGVATVAGTSFGEFGEGFIRLSCASSDEAIEEAMGAVFLRRLSRRERAAGGGSRKI